MAIDITTETVITPAKATHFCPERRSGVRPNVATIYRWMMNGVRGIRLESIVVGATALHVRRGAATFLRRTHRRRRR